VVVGGGARGKDDKPDAKPTMQAADPGSPLKKKLDSGILQNKKTDKPAAGLLYFPMEKQKMKNLELTYGGKENRITLRFKT